ncbi:MAG TPA: helix-turn-helix transcriptional regulator [Candidatus Fimicola cottocaccae]|nr:helix-turn-helix transcriptional regulator [Candidatus Fimicola cottocaccae]
MKFDKELLKGSTNMIILNLLEKQDMYGYQIIKVLEQKSENIFEFKEGTLYPILHSLEEKNYINSYWDETGSKKRKYYTITKKGKAKLKEKKEEWNLFSNGINKLIGGVNFAN